MDIIRDLGYLTLGTRFRRIGERLQAQTQVILEAHGITLPAAQFPFLAALDRLGPLGIVELAEAVGVTQPAATRVAAQLAEAELVTITASDEDQRRRTVELSRQGKRLVSDAKRTAWRVVERAVRDACHSLQGQLLEQLASLESRLEARPLVERAARGAERRRP